MNGTARRIRLAYTQTAIKKEVEQESGPGMRMLYHPSGIRMSKEETAICLSTTTAETRSSGVDMLYTRHYESVDWSMANTQHFPTVLRSDTCHLILMKRSYETLLAEVGKSLDSKDAVS